MGHGAWVDRQGRETDRQTRQGQETGRKGGLTAHLKRDETLTFMPLKQALKLCETAAAANTFPFRAVKTRCLLFLLPCHAFAVNRLPHCGTHARWRAKTDAARQRKTTAWRKLRAKLPAAAHRRCCHRAPACGDTTPLHHPHLPCALPLSCCSCFVPALHISLLPVSLHTHLPLPCLCPPPFPPHFLCLSTSSLDHMLWHVFSMPAYMCFSTPSPFFSLLCCHAAPLPCLTFFSPCAFRFWFWFFSSHSCFLPATLPCLLPAFAVYVYATISTFFIG